jgi:hypothetical protein
MLRLLGQLVNRLYKCLFPQTFCPSALIHFPVVSNPKSENNQDLSVWLVNTKSCILMRSLPEIRWHVKCIETAKHLSRSVLTREKLAETAA